MPVVGLLNLKTAKALMSAIGKKRTCHYDGLRSFT
jgi:hypothetical protein